MGSRLGSARLRGSLERVGGCQAERSQEASARGDSSVRLSSPPSAERWADGKFPGDDFRLELLPWV